MSAPADLLEALAHADDDGEAELDAGSLRWGAEGVTWTPSDGPAQQFAEGSRVQLSQGSEQAPANWLLRLLRRPPPVRRWLAVELRSREARVSFDAPLTADTPEALTEAASVLEVHDAHPLPAASLRGLLRAALQAGAALARGGGATDEAPVAVRDVSSLRFSSGLAPWEREPASWCYVDTLGRVALEGPYRSARGFSEQRAAVETEGGWGFIDTEGEPVGPQDFTRVKRFKDGHARVYRPGFSGYFLRMSASGEVEDRSGRVRVAFAVTLVVLGLVLAFTLRETTPQTTEEPADDCSSVESCVERCEAGESPMCYKAGKLIAYIDLDEEAQSTFERYCEAGVGVACHRLAYRHEGARHIELLHRGCVLRHRTACNALFERYDEEGALGQPITEAADAYLALCDEELSYYCRNLADYYKDTQEIARAAALYQALCEEGVPGPDCKSAAALWLHQPEASGGSPEEGLARFQEVCPLEGTDLPGRCGASCLYACYQLGRARWSGLGGLTTDRVAAVEIQFNICQHETPAPIACSEVKRILDRCLEDIKAGGEAAPECERAAELLRAKQE